MEHILPIQFGKHQKLILLAFVLLIGIALAVVYWASTKAAWISGPGAAAIDTQNRLWLNVDRFLLVISSDGKIVHEFDLPKLEIESPIASIARYRDGEMLLGSRPSGAIYRVSEAGEKLMRLGSSTEPAWKPFGPFHLVYLPDQRHIVMTDPSNHRIMLLDEQGNLVRESLSPRTSDTYRFPNGVTVDNLGRIVVVDTNNRRVHVLDTDLETQSTWSPVKYGTRYKFPVFIAQLPSDDYFITIHDHQLDFAEIVRLNALGERQDTVPFESDVIPNGFLAFLDGLLVMDTAAPAIWRVQPSGNSVSRFGDTRLQELLQNSADAKAYYKKLVTISQRSLVALLVLLLVVAVVMQLIEQKRSERIPLPVEKANLPPAQIWPALRQAFCLLPIVLLPFILVLSMLVQVYGACSLSTDRWMDALAGNIVLLLPLIGIAWLTRSTYRSGILLGRYHKLFVHRAHLLLNRHRAVLAGNLAQDEQVLGFELGVLMRMPAVVVITNKRLWVMTLSLFGTRARRLQAINLSAITGSTVVELGAFRNYLKFLGVPVWQLQLNVVGSRKRYAIDIPDGYWAQRFADLTSKLTTHSIASSGPAIRDFECPDCVVPGHNVTVAAVLSLLFPGLGQFYSEEMYKGLVLLISGGFFWIILLEPITAYIYRTKDVSVTSVSVLIAMLLTIWAFALIDAIVTTRRNRLNPVGVLVLD